MKEVNWWAYSLLFQKDRLFLKIRITSAIFNSVGNFPFKIALLIQWVKGMHISFASECKTFVGIVPLVDLF